MAAIANQHPEAEDFSGEAVLERLLSRYDLE